MSFHGPSTNPGLMSFPSGHDADDGTHWLSEGHTNGTSQVQVKTSTNKSSQSSKQDIATITRKYKLRRKETELKRQRKPIRKGHFICEHCGLLSRCRTTVPITSARKRISNKNLQRDPASQEQPISGTCVNLKSRKCKNIDADRCSNESTIQDIRSIQGTSQNMIRAGVIEAELNSYLCGKCHQGFDDIELLIDHVISCKNYSVLTDAGNEANARRSDEKVTSEASTEIKFCLETESDVQLKTQSENKTLSGSVEQSSKLSNDKLRNDNGKGMLKTRSGRRAGYLVVGKRKAKTIIKNNNGRRTGKTNESDEENKERDKGIDANNLLKAKQKEGTKEKSDNKLQVNTTRSRQKAKDLAENQNEIINATDNDEWFPENDDGNTINESTKTDKSKLKTNLTNKCTICHKTFSQKSSLYRHCSLVHKGIKKHECKTCHKRYQQKHNLTKHKCIGQHLPVSNSLLCIMCGKHFSSAGSLKHHERTLHAESKQFSCPTCGRAFASAGNMREHLKAVHNGRSYLCDLCGRSFSFKNSYNRHQRSHTGAKPYRCQHCDRAFSSCEGRQLHELTHVTTEKVQCEYCGKRMKNLLCVSYHMKKHHGKDENRGFQCYRCRTKYDSNISLAKHMEECHKNQLVCQYCYNTFSSKSNLNQHMRTHSVVAEESMM